jgi:spermidine/putrescine transport system permease protein
MRHRRGTALKVYGFLVYFFLYMPLAVVLVFSFSPTKAIEGMEGFTLRWYLPAPFSYRG